MFFPFIIIVRLLFAASMVFILGYVFGGFSKKRSLTRLTRVAAILIIVLFVAETFFSCGNWSIGIAMGDSTASALSSRALGKAVW